MLWKYGNDSTGADSVSITDKRVYTYLNSLTYTNHNVIKSACGENIEINDIATSLGVFDLGTKQYISNQYADCLFLLSGDYNKDAVTRQEAKSLRDTTLVNVKRFIDEAQIK